MNNAHYLLLKDKLLPDYKEAHQHVVGMFSVNGAKEYLASKNMHAGICYAANKNYHEIISETDWVGHFKRTFMGFWGRTPSSAVYFYEVIRALELRISIMEQLVAAYRKSSNPELDVTHPSDEVRFY